MQEFTEKSKEETKLLMEGVYEKFSAKACRFTGILIHGIVMHARS